MHISLSNQQLLLLLIGAIIAGAILRLLSIRSRYQSGKRRSRGSRQAAPRPRTTPRKASRGTPERGDKGAQIAHKYGMARSPLWPGVAHQHLLHEPACTVCGHTGKGLQVHHIRPFHLFPELELDPKNLITLCEIKGRDHHLLVGHLDDWESYNLHVRSDVQRYANENAKHIREEPHWQKEVLQRPQA